MTITHPTPASYSLTATRWSRRSTLIDSIGTPPNCMALSQQNVQGRVYDLFSFCTCSMSVIDKGVSIYIPKKPQTLGIWESFDQLANVGVNVPERPVIELLIDDRNTIQHRF